MLREVDVLIIGGGPAGVETYRALAALHRNKGLKIELVRREEKSIVPCGIPYTGVSVPLDRNVIPDARLGIRAAIDVVTEVDPDKGVARTAGGTTYKYKHLVLATGSVSTEPRFEGSDRAGVFKVVKDLEYLRRMWNYIRQARRVAVVGGGPVGIEFADELRRMEREVVLIELMPRLLPTAFDPEFGELARAQLVELDVDVRLGTAVVKALGEGRVEAVELGDGQRIPVDAVLWAAGMRPDTALAAAAGIKLGPTGAIAVNRRMETSHSGVYAVGDCAEKAHFITGRPVWFGSSSLAAHEARIAAGSILGLEWVGGGALCALITVVGDIALGRVGVTEEEARQAGIKVAVGKASAVDKHPPELPGARNILAKLIFNASDGGLIGAEVAAGKHGGEIINILAVLVRRRATAREVYLGQFATQPWVTASPIAYPIIRAAENAIVTHGLR
jgi:pyruvate/2-oxoglutarate dehydrogenase complex dihydrolipoamide dehydrogenase (E3) component